MMKNTQILSDITVHMKYAKYDAEKLRRETWREICDRNMNMHIKAYPQLEQDIRNVYEHFVVPKKVLPSPLVAHCPACLPIYTLFVASTSRHPAYVPMKTLS